MSRFVFCLVPSQRQASGILANLQTQGFAGSEISVLYPSEGDMPDAGQAQATKAPEGTAAGAATGGVAGGLVGLLTGLGALAIPGLGAFVAAGPLLAALSGAAIGATTGGLVGGLIGLGLPEEQAHRYAARVQGGSFLISVRTVNRAEEERATATFVAENAEDVGSVEQAAIPLA